MSKIWDQEEINFIINYYDNNNAAELGSELGRTAKAIKAKVVRLRKEGLIPKIEDKNNDIAEDERRCNKCNGVFKENEMEFKKLRHQWNICKACACEEKRLKRIKKIEESLKGNIQELIEENKAKTYTCARCHKELPGVNFYFSSKTGKPYPYCKKCNVERNNELEIKKLKGEL